MKIAALGIGHFHSPCYIKQELLRNNGHEIAGLHEDDPEIAAAKSARLDLPVQTDPVRMLDQAKPDFAVVMGSVRRMPELLNLVIERDIPFLIEKPGARCADELLPLVHKAHARRLFGSVAFCFRWHPGLRLIADWMKQGRLGQPGLIRLEYFAGPVTRYPAMSSPWVQSREEAGGGCLMNCGTHAIDVLRFLNLSPQFAEGLPATPWAHADFEDIAHLSFRCGPAIATVDTGYVAAGSGLALDMKAEKANISMRKSLVTLTNPDKSVEEHPFPDGDYRDEMFLDLLSSAHQGLPSPIPIEAALETLRLIDSFYAHCRPSSPVSESLTSTTTNR